MPFPREKLMEARCEVVRPAAIALDENRATSPRVRVVLHLHPVDGGRFALDVRASLHVADVELLADRVVAEFGFNRLLFVSYGRALERYDRVNRHLSRLGVIHLGLDPSDSMAFLRAVL